MAEETQVAQTDPVEEPAVEETTEQVVEETTEETQEEATEETTSGDTQGDAEEAAAEETEEEATEEQPPVPPQLPPEVQAAVAYGTAADQVMRANPQLAALFNAEYAKLSGLQQARAPEPELTIEQARAEADAMIERGDRAGAMRLLIKHDPDVVAARKYREENEVRRAAETRSNAQRIIGEHYRLHGKPDDAVSSGMKRLFDAGYEGGLLNARVASLHELGRHDEASTLAQKAPRPKRPQPTAGGRVPTAAGSPAPRRVKKVGSSDPKNIDQGFVDYIEKREKETRSDSPL